MESDPLRRAVNESCDLARRGEDRQALRVLDEAIAAAGRENRSLWVVILARHASVIADHLGDLDLSRRYCEHALAWNEDDPLMLYSLADILHRQADTPSARQYALKAYRTSANRGGDLDPAIAELLLHRWPDLAQNPK